jgi:UDP-glucose 4-epimerase
MSKILVTGCAGLFGSHLCEHFLKQGHEVIGVDNLQGGYKDFIPKKTIFWKTDLRNSAILKGLFSSHKPDYVYHTAAFAAVCLSPFMKHECYQNNMLSYANLTNNCIQHGVKKIIFFSSMDVYGTGQVPFRENDISRPEDPYGISKLAIEQDLKSTEKQFGLKYNIVRPHNVFGPQQNIWDRYRNVLGIWILKCLNGKPITIYGDGSQRRAFSHVKYYMDPLAKIMKPKYDNLTFNIGADQDVSILETANLLQKIALKKGYKSDIIHLEPRNEVQNAYADHTLAKTVLGFKDKTDLEQLLVEMFEWAEKQPNRPVRTVKYEITDGLYSYWK